MKIDTAQIDWAEFESRLRVEIGREAFANTSEMTGIIGEVISSDEVRSVLSEHDGSEFQRWRVLFKRYPSIVAIKLEDRLACAGYPLSERLNRDAFEAWPRSIRISVERAAQKALPWTAH